MQDTIRRYKRGTIWFHWAYVAASMVLFITGIFLFVPGWGVVAQDSITRVIHKVAAVMFVAGPVIYFATNPRMAVHVTKDVLTWGKEDLTWLRVAPNYYFGGPEENMPPQGYTNPGQKMWQIIVLVSFPVFVATGFIMWMLKGIVSPTVFQWCLVIHGIAFVVTGLMLIVHVYLGAIHPRMTESMLSMRTGEISTEYAKSHYGKWYNNVIKKRRSKSTPPTP
jgi:formate dehydrogenase subunit gamma